mmetsp:Transcript_3204/g.7502  ORF Transcript_3204/g.7502 Transcript_3204/m.7502 type:complete len:84 (+) Transcript_3204:352-603(+)
MEERKTKTLSVNPEGAMGCVVDPRMIDSLGHSEWEQIVRHFFMIWDYRYQCEIKSSRNVVKFQIGFTTVEDSKTCCQKQSLKC